MIDRGATYADEQAWRREQHDLFRHVGELLSDVIPPTSWHKLGVTERLRRVDEAADLLRRELGVKRTTPIKWVDDPTNAGAGYDEQSEAGDIHYPKHHLEQAEPHEFVRGLTEEMRHAWQDDVCRGLTDHPLGEIARRALECGFATYDESDPRTETSNILELDAKECAEWCVDGYLGNLSSFD